MGYTIAMQMNHKLTIQIQTVLLLGGWGDCMYMWLPLIGCNDRVVYLPLWSRKRWGGSHACKLRPTGYTNESNSRYWKLRLISNLKLDYVINVMYKNLYVNVYIYIYKLIKQHLFEERLYRKFL